jgi:hypothetical protein
MIGLPRHGTNMGRFRNVQTIFSSDSKSERVSCAIENAIFFREHAGQVRNGGFVDDASLFVDDASLIAVHGLLRFKPN